MCAELVTPRPTNGNLMNHDLKVFWENLYAELHEYWENKRSFLPRTGDLKFGIFYSPVHAHPDLMIIGANPGFDSDDDTKAPPDTNLFYDPIGRNPKEWKISPAMRKLFQPAGQEEMLRNSVVLNLLFFKSRCLGRHAGTGQGWRDNRDANVRHEIEHYCRHKVEQIVSQLAPARILVLGLATWDKLAEPQAKLVARRRGLRGRLAVAGTVFNRSALGIIHPTGAQIRYDERRELANHLGAFLRGNLRDLG